MKQGLNNFQHYKNIHAIHSKNDNYVHLYQQEPDVSLSVVEHKIIYHRQTSLHSNICCKQPSSKPKTSKDAKNRSCFTAKTKQMQRNCWIKLQRIKKSFPLTILKESG